MSGALLSHKDTSIVPEAVVRAEPLPIARTATFRPYTHGQVIDAVGQACSKLDWKVERKQYAIRPGSKMFGVWDLERIGSEIVKGEETTLSLGIRNGLNKSMSVGLCAGVRVFVCDNMVFRGDFVLFRKHTAGLEELELEVMAEEALGALRGRFARVAEWHDGLKKIELRAEQAALLAVAAMHRKYPLIPPAKYDQFHEFYFGAGSKYTPTLHGFHGAITEMWHETHLVDYSWRSGLLVDFLDHEAPLLLGEAQSATVWQPGRVPFEIIQDEAKELRDGSKAEGKAAARVEVQAVKDKVQARLKEAAKAAKPTEAEALMEKAAKKAKAKPEAKPKEKAGKKPRRTARVKIREKIAAESKPAGRKAGLVNVPGIGPVVVTGPAKSKKVRAEKVTTAKAAARKKAKADDGDLYFCMDCCGEFSPAETVKSGTDIVCLRCNEGRKEAAGIGKRKRSK